MTRAKAVKKKTEQKNELNRLKDQIETLKAEKVGHPKTNLSFHKFSLKVSEKGGCSVYGLGRFPITLYQEQWLTILERAEDIKKFLQENESVLSSKYSSMFSEKSMDCSSG